MLLTVFYMISTWVQAWKLSSLKARLTLALNLGLDTTKPSIMFYIKLPDLVKDDEMLDKKLEGANNDLLSSHMCSNKNIAKLGDLLWCQGDKRLCTIYPLQKIDVSEWLLYDSNQMNFPLYMNNNITIGQLNQSNDAKVHVLIEADIENYCPHAFSKLTKLENYGVFLAWTVDRVFATVIETDVDHMTKLSIALMQSQCYINNGMTLTRMESVTIIGKPCTYNIGMVSVLRDKGLVGKDQWEAYIKKLKLFSSTARHVVQHGKPFEIDILPAIIISPGSRLLSLQMPVVLTIDALDTDSRENVREDCHTEKSVPITPPASTDIFHQSSTLSVFNETQSESTNQSDLNKVSFDSISDERKQEKSIASSSLSSQLPQKSNLLNMTPQKPPRKQFSTLRGKKIDSFDASIKPPNVLIYADNTMAKENIKKVLEMILSIEKYTIYTLSLEDARKDHWIDQANLLIVCGNVDSEIASQIIEYIVKGGKVLTLCSDALNHLLPSFKTAEVRENELVRFSYGTWKNVQMMHDIFCYQESPTKSRFSQDQEDSKILAPQQQSGVPVSANIRDKSGKSHVFRVKVLGTEETWQTPSIVLADLSTTGGKIIFSQIHLEADPSKYECEELKFQALKASNTARLEILSNLLAVHLAMDIDRKSYVEPIFEPGFFLGRHELKLNMLDSLKDEIQANDTLQMSNLQLKFCSANSKVATASSSVLPIMIHQCPDNFSTIDYFENLKTKELGRLVIYANAMTSSMDVVKGCQLHHGLVVIPRRQTQGQGRGKNIWLSPEGCAMFTIQLHIPLNSYIGSHLPILQNLVSVAIVSAITSVPGYENMNLRIKWPNDIYAGSQIKLGGLIVTTLVKSKNAICNIGVGVNLSNNHPTSCINGLIKNYNEKNSTNLSSISYERYFALVFTELENLFEKVQNNNIQYFYDLYYEYWIHTDTEVSIISDKGDKQSVKIQGIDDFGFLKVEGKDGKIITVHPDGNSFDITKGLIVPKPDNYNK